MATDDAGQLVQRSQFTSAGQFTRACRQRFGSAPSRTLRTGQSRG